MDRRSTLNEKGHWFKGNTHAHTDISDGFYTPEKLAERYRELGYDFLAITDHRVYGVHNDLNRPDFLLLPGVELDIAAQRQGISCHHVVGLGLPEKNLFSHGSRVDYPENAKISDIIDILERNGNLCIYAHPNWSHSIHEELLSLRGLTGLEIYNHTTGVTRASGYSESYYDRMLWDKKHLWCFACDDTHHRKDDIGGGFIMVKAGSLDQGSVIDALQMGSFYASQGPEIFDFYIENDYADLTCSPCRSIGFQCDSERGGAVNSKKACLTWAEHKLQGTESYIRAFCVDKFGYTAWAQPVYI